MMHVLAFFSAGVAFIAAGTVVFIRAMDAMKALQEQFADDTDVKDKLASLSSALLLLYMFMVLGLAMIGGKILLA
jgi:predicted oxidoreductase (fatty acid repression mutant protein)